MPDQTRDEIVQAYLAELGHKLANRIGRDPGPMAADGLLADLLTIIADLTVRVADLERAKASHGIGIEQEPFEFVGKGPINGP